MAIAVATVMLVLVVTAAFAANSGEWPGYLLDSGHSSAGSASVITPGNAGTLRKAWTFKAAAATMSGQPGPQFYASPTVAGGMVFIGANTGVFYALNLSTGAVVWKRFLGFQPGLGC